MDSAWSRTDETVASSGKYRDANLGEALWVDEGGSGVVFITGALVRW